MTMPRERLNAVVWAKKLLRSLLVPKETPRVPREIRRQALYVLKHFPTEYDLERAAKKAPDVFMTEKQDKAYWDAFHKQKGNK